MFCSPVASYTLLSSLRLILNGVRIFHFFFIYFQYHVRVNISLHYRPRVAIPHTEVCLLLSSHHVNNIVSHCHSLTQEASSFLNFVPPSNECHSCGGGGGGLLDKVVELHRNIKFEFFFLGAKHKETKIPAM